MATIRMEFGVRLLETLTSALYEDPIIFFREYVQNSVDAYMVKRRDPSKAFDGFYTDITIDEERSCITILDNGYGIEEGEFKRKMMRIGYSDKGPMTGQIGFRGIGRLSGLPFCSRLVFTSKPEGLNKCLVFTWDGDEFEALLDQENDTALDEAVERITKPTEETYEGPVGDHFFRVEMRGYKEAATDLLRDKDFEMKLRRMLPLQYSPDFTHQDTIKDRYQEFMGKNLDEYSFAVRLNGKPLYKVYENKHILESGIQFWDLKYPSAEGGVPGDKIGVLWFTFNPWMESNPKNEPYGILVRSKNMLMGGSDSIAEAVSRSKTEYVSTTRELVQTLRAVYGEMLINSRRLHDNARRDWFKLDSASTGLTHIIVDFMKRLWNYRYTASDYYNGKERDKKKVIQAYTELTTHDPDASVVSFERKVEQGEKFKFANDDIPHQPVTIKRFYDKLAMLLYEYLKGEKEGRLFPKIRLLVKEKLDRKM